MQIIQMTKVGASCALRVTAPVREVAIRKVCLVVATNARRDIGLTELVDVTDVLSGVETGTQCFGDVTTSKNSHNSNEV